MSWDSRENYDSTDGPLIFQTLDWYCEDTPNDNGFLEYTVYVFGVDAENRPVTACLKNFYPFFFIEIPDTWGQSCVYSVKEAIGRSVKLVEYIQRKMGKLET